MKNKRKRNFYPNQKLGGPKTIDSVLSMMRSMPLTKRIKLAIWLLSYTFVTIFLLFSTATISIVSIALFMHYV